ncbi:MAG: DUF4864 domain-containing protein [Chloroflexi bacterium]|nr:DUF4864 domain-containing protein [Chloroflexota bacterium]
MATPEELYTRFTAAEASGDFQGAFDYLHEIQQQQPDYRDVATRYAQYREQGYEPSHTTGAADRETTVGGSSQGGGAIRRRNQSEGDTSESGGGRRRGCLIVAFGAFAALFLCGIVAGAVFFLGFTTTDVSVGVVDDFFKATTAGDIQRAYDHFHPQLQQEQSLQDLTQVVQSNPSIFQVSSVNFLNRSVVDAEATLIGEVTGRDGTRTPARFDLRFDDVWKIVGYELGPGVAE